MVVVADTSPINYLIQISCIHILPALYQKVIVPRAVIDELGHRNAPEAVASWASQPPSWISVSDLQTPVDDNELRKLDSGEIAVSRCCHGSGWSLFFPRHTKVKRARSSRMA